MTTDVTTDAPDLVIIGGGLAGSALAARLAGAGWQILLLEKSAFPRDKLCGEFLSHESQRLLRRIGCLDRVHAAGAVPITRARFTSPHGHVMHVTLPGVALGISRRALDELLFRHAASCGANAQECADVRRLDVRDDSVVLRVQRDGTDTDWQAPLAVGAWGRRSRLDRELGRPFMQEPQPFAGLKRHHRPVAGAAGRELADELQPAVEIHAVDGGYCGMSYVETGEVNVCMLLEQRFLSRLADRDWDTVRDALCAGNRELRRRLDALEPTEPGVHAVGAVPFNRKQAAWRDRLLFVGDTAGVIAPLCGDGQAMALQGADMLADLLLATGRPGDCPPAAITRLAHIWSTRFVRTFGRRLGIGRWLQTRLFRPRWADTVIRLLNAFPFAARILAEQTRSR